MEPLIPAAATTTTTAAVSSPSPSPLLAERYAIADHRPNLEPHRVVHVPSEHPATCRPSLSCSEPRCEVEGARHAQPEKKRSSLSPQNQPRF